MLIRTIGLLILFFSAGCATTTNECVNIGDEWSQSDVSKVPAEVDLERVFSGQWMSTRDESEIRWYRDLNDSHFACFPGWTDDGCGEETYRIMIVDGEWQAVFFDGMICTGLAPSTIAYDVS